MQYRPVFRLIALTTMLFQAAGELVITPHNSESKVGDTTYFNCSTDLETEEIYWYHGVTYTIYNGFGILQPYNGRFWIDRNASKGSHNLVIYSVKPGDAGEYICADDHGLGTRRSAELIVLDDDPVCQTNIQPDGVIGQNIFNIPPDEVHLTCNVTYHGKFPPEMAWRKVGDNSYIKASVNMSNIISNKRAIYTLKFIGDSSLDGSSYICQTMRPTGNQYKCTSEIIEVLYFVERSTIEQTVFRDEKIACVASNSTFRCTSQWYRDNYTCPLSCDETITAHLLGMYLCTVRCHVRGKDYYFDALKVFVVEPIASPLQSTSGTILTAVVVPIAIIFVITIAFISIAVLISRRMRRKYEQMMNRREYMFEYLEDEPLLKTSESEITDVSHVICRNHQFLVENIKSRHLVDRLSENKCITDQERDHLSKQSTEELLNNALLTWMETIPFREDKGQKILDCFRHTEQNFIADLLEKGGVLIRSHISTRLVKVDSIATSSLENADRLKEKEIVVIERLRKSQGLSFSSIDNPRRKILVDHIFITSFCHQAANGIVIWFWCKSKEGEKKLQRMYESDILLRKLVKMFKQFSRDCASSTSKLLVPTSINIFMGDFEDKIAEEEIELVQKIKLDKKQKERDISGVAILDEKLFVVRVENSKITVYNCKNFHDWKLLKVNGLVSTNDMCSCKKNKSLYIMDEKIGDKPAEILRINPEGIVMKRWLTETTGSISVATEGNVILTDEDGQMLLEYSPDGNLVREINLPECANLQHAIKVDNNCYIVSHGGFLDSFHRVCIVDKDGKIEKSFGSESGSTEKQLNVPYHLAAGNSGYVIVADKRNNRMLLLDENLEFKAKLVPKYKQRFRGPYTVTLSERLLVVLVDAGIPFQSTFEEEGHSRKATKNNDFLIEKDCELLVFDLQPLSQKYKL